MYGEHRKHAGRFITEHGEWAVVEAQLLRRARRSQAGHVAAPMADEAPAAKKAKRGHEGEAVAATTAAAVMA